MPVILYPSAPPLSQLILGSSTFGREIDAAAAFALMDGAVERDLTMIDTAATYSAGAAEQMVGDWLASRRPDPARLMVATKIYPPFVPEAIDQAAAASARQLQVAVIDVLYLHKWAPEAETPETLRALDGLVRSGRVRALGVSNFTSEQLTRVRELQTQLGLAPFQLLQNNNNLALREVDASLVEACRSHRVALVTYSPLGAGFLTGKHRGGVEKGSRFDLAPAHQPLYFQPTAEKRLDHLSSISRRTGLPMAHLALAWAMHRPGVTSVLVGGRTPAYLDQALRAQEFNFPALFAELEAD